MSRPTIDAWLSRSVYEDKRGWKKGVTRRYDEAVGERICSLKRARIDGNRYFLGSPYIQMDYAKTYPGESPPSIWRIDEAVRTAGLQTRVPRPHPKRGGAKHLLFPFQSIRELGRVHQSADFIGRKYITGCREPVHFFSQSYDIPFKLLNVARIPAETGVYARERMLSLWEEHPLPDVFRLDNGLQFAGTNRAARKLSETVCLLLNLGITPVFSAPCKPWTNPYIEGHNRVFTATVWTRNRFTSLEQIDRECNRLTAESVEYYRFRYAHLIHAGSFRRLSAQRPIPTDRLRTTRNKKLYFIRFAELPDQNAKHSVIVILNETVQLPESLSHQFVFAEWNLENEQLNIFSEYEGRRIFITRIHFKINW